MKTEDFKTAEYILERQKTILAIQREVEGIQREYCKEGGTARLSAELQGVINKLRKEMERLLDEFKSI